MNAHLLLVYRRNGAFWLTAALASGTDTVATVLDVWRSFEWGPHCVVRLWFWEYLIQQWMLTVATLWIHLVQMKFRWCTAAGRRLWLHIPTSGWHLSPGVNTTGWTPSHAALARLVVFHSQLDTGNSAAGLQKITKILKVVLVGDHLWTRRDWHRPTKGCSQKGSSLKWIEIGVLSVSVSGTGTSFLLNWCLVLEKDLQQTFWS